MSSNIPKARGILRQAVMKSRSKKVTALINQALALMTRESPIRRAKRKRKPINWRMRRAILKLSHNLDLSEHDIANIVGLRNNGRVSDVLHGKR